MINVGLLMFLFDFLRSKYFDLTVHSFSLHFFPIYKEKFIIVTRPNACPKATTSSKTATLVAR